MAEQYDILIAGGGFVGLALAIAAAREGLTVVVVEQASMPAQLEPRFDGRVSAVALGSKYLLENIGVWHNLAEHAQPIVDIRVSDGASPFFLHYDHREVGTEPFGYIVENRHLRWALQCAAQALPTITLMENRTLASLQEIPCRLLVGADGKKSAVRAMAGIKTLEWPYRQTAIVCTIAHEHSHEGLAQERFLPAGPFAVLPMTGNRSSLVWVEPQERVATYLALPEDEFVQEIRARVGDYLGDIQVQGPRFSYPLSVSHARSYIGERLALIGDAAHAIHPIAGQGVNLGFRDVAVLAELIVAAQRRGEDIGAAGLLAHYQRWRRFDNTAMIAVTDGLTRLFSNDVLPLRIARGLGLWAVGKVPPVKRFFMRHAMGTAGDVPRLMKQAC